MDVRTLLRGHRDTRPRSWALWLALSLILHAPATPLMGLLGVLGLIARTEDSGPAAPPITEIPVDILNEDPGAGNMNAAASPAAPAAGLEPSEAPAEPAPKPKNKPKRVAHDAGSLLDAGVADAAGPGAVPTDAGVADAAPTDAGLADAGKQGTPDGGDAGAGIGDPMAVAGALRRVADPNANVQLLVDTEKLRAHPLGARIGGLLAGVYQWRDFFGPAAIDPVRDIDRILIVGSQLRRSADVIAVIQHRLGHERMRAAIDRVVRNDTEQGAWLDAGVPVATARADRAPRFFVMTSPRVVIVTPESSLKSAERFSKRYVLPKPGGDAVAIASVKTPWRAFRGLPLRIPESIRWARARIEPTPDGGAAITIEAEDESPELAQQNAKQLVRDINSLAELDFGLLGMFLGRPKRFIGEVAFEASQSRIFGRITLSQSQILTLVDLARMWLVPAPPRPATQGRPGLTANPGTGSVPRRAPLPGR